MAQKKRIYLSGDVCAGGRGYLRNNFHRYPSIMDDIRFESLVFSPGILCWGHNYSGKKCVVGINSPLYAARIQYPFTRFRDTYDRRT